MNENDDINDYIPSILNPRSVRKEQDLSLTQFSIASRCSLSLKRPKQSIRTKVNANKENVPTPNKIVKVLNDLNKNSVHVTKTDTTKSFNQEPHKTDPPKQINKDCNETFECFDIDENKVIDKTEEKLRIVSKSCAVKHNINIDDTESIKHLLSLSSATELLDIEKEADKEIKSDSTITYVLNDEPPKIEKAIINISFGLIDSEFVKVSAKNSAIKTISLIHNYAKDNTKVDCELVENSQISTETDIPDLDENMNETFSSPQKRSGVDVNLEIKKKKLTDVNNEEKLEKVLILNTNAIEKISHVIVQPPNYKFVKRNLKKSKCDNSFDKKQNGKRLKQVAIDSFLRSKVCEGTANVPKDMIKTSPKCDRVQSATPNILNSPRKGFNECPNSARLPVKRDILTQEFKTQNANPISPTRNQSLSANTSKNTVESLYFGLQSKSRINRTSATSKSVPFHKIVAGTNFAVDAFSYGEIPNIRHYFLTHFHSDHYCGLKKSFNKTLYCSKITADLCMTRLGVNAKNIRIINVDEILSIDGVEITALEANHCPGSLMFVFTLSNGKSLLHTGDFRACPEMESYPVFWNKDIHTVYLDTTYCNPRYDFPTQDESLEIALHILREKKMALEKAGKKFASVLIVCGTYTIGKEKFFLGLSRRVGCSVWACPQKERVLQAVEESTGAVEGAGRAPQTCQIHVVPMRDLTHEKLRSYLDSFGGVFSEVVAFKPSGWEISKHSAIEKDQVAIHGIPYSEHSSFSELIRFVKFLKPKQVVPTVDISGGVKSVQKYFPCPLLSKEEQHCQTRVTDFFSIHNKNQLSAVT